jgi:uncharacterized protein
VKADFVPGDKIIFYDDFSDMVGDEPPPHWKVRGGAVELRVGSGVRQLTVMSGNPRLTPMLKGLPKNFTLETELKFDDPVDVRSIWYFYDATWDGPNGPDAALRVFLQSQTGALSVQVRHSGKDGVEDLANTSVQVDFSQPVKEAVWVQNGRLRVYINGERAVDVNQVELPPLTGAELGPEYGEAKLGYRMVRFAESTPDFSQVISSSGRYVTHGIQFDTDSDRLKPESAPIIKSVARGLETNPNLKLQIEGHTDSTGNADHNLDLSKRRAEAVKAMLVSQFKVDAARLTTVGLGATKPIDSNDTPQGRAQNRRVEFVRQQAGSKAARIFLVDFSVAMGRGARPAMRWASRGFQVFVKPAGPLCNLACRYCYYVGKELYARSEDPPRMSDDLLEDYIVQHIAASPDEIIRFSWHGGEPTVLGLDFFRRAAAIQRKHRPAGRLIANGLQTNGILLDEGWGRFLAEEGFAVGLSLDGPRDMHDRHRTSKDGKSTFDQVMRGYEVLRRHQVSTDILCVVSDANVSRPLEVFGFFKGIGASYLTFIPLVEKAPGAGGGVTAETVPAAAWGEFLCAVFDEWVGGDIGRVKVQIFEEAARAAFGQEHSLCIFRPVCGDIPVVERNGDFYACDHFVDPAHRIGNLLETPLAELLESPAQKAFGQAKRDSLPRYCRECESLEMCHGECPKNRFIRTPDGENGLNYLCEGYRRFFRHCRPFVDAVAAAWRRQSL